MAESREKGREPNEVTLGGGARRKGGEQGGDKGGEWGGGEREGR